jgi:putative FmdB family regulatory protein
MPIYEYKCDSCGAITERLQKMSDKPLKKCPKCGGSVEKIISRTSFHLKGSGWYVTDYGKGTGGAAGTRKKPKAEEGAKAESSKSESADSGASKTKSKSKKAAQSD